MKSAVVYVVALALGSGLGAFGMGAYNAVVVGVELPADSAAVADSTEHAESGEVDGSETGTAPPVEVADGGSQSGSEAIPDDPSTVGGGETTVEGGAEDAPEGGGAAGGLSGSGGEATPPVAVAQVPAPDPDSLARAQQNYQRLARIFAAMKPEEAAPVLAQLNDAQLEGILLAMQGRNAAPILAEMDPERAASISRRVLGGS